MQRYDSNLRTENTGALDLFKNTKYQSDINIVNFSMMYIFQGVISLPAGSQPYIFRIEIGKIYEECSRTKY